MDVDVDPNMDMGMDVDVDVDMDMDVDVNVDIDVLLEIAGCAACTSILILFSNHVLSEDGTHLFTWKPTGF